MPRTIPTQRVGSTTSWVDSPTPPRSATAKASASPGNTTGAEVISSCSLAKVTTEPAKDTDPTKMVNAVATSTNQPVSPPASMISRSSSSATRAAAPPPTPLNSATICGIWVICTRRAPKTPPAAPITIAPRISGTWCRWSTPLGL